MDRPMTMNALCFTTGVALGLIMGPSMSLAAACGGMMAGYLLSYPRTGSGNDAAANAGLALLLISAGLLCACRASSHMGGHAPALLERGASVIREAIDRAPFRRDDTPELLKAFLTGDRSGLGKDDLEIFRRSGASHLLALSGLHMGIIYIMLSKAAGILGGNPVVRHIAGLAIILSTGTFTLMTGASPSCVRAFLFIAVRETARMLGRETSLLQCLSLALIMQLGIAPGNISKVGFQMSYLAMLGISLLFPSLQKLYPGSGRYDPLARIWNMAALSISCQAFTAPLSWHIFHSFPQYFLVTNLLAMPVMTVLMAVSIMTVALLSAGICPMTMIQATDMLCGLLMNILETISLL